ncbi:hypothetical protein SOVF_011950 [Spinacia oleracea]|nr:hypothetical protein SOVF_011950 [Spinacia oleracea]
MVRRLQPRLALPREEIQGGAVRDAIDDMSPLVKKWNDMI